MREKSLEERVEGGKKKRKIRLDKKRAFRNYKEGGVERKGKEVKYIEARYNPQKGNLRLGSKETRTQEVEGS